jgi:PKD repeat protein
MMKRFTLLIALLGTLSLTFGQNLIVNGDFEIPGMAADPVPAPWGGFKNRIRIDTTINSYVGQITNGDGSLFQEFSVQPDSEYVVTFDYFWIGSSGAANTVLTVRVKDANNLPTNLDLIGGTSSDGYKLDETVDQWFTQATFRFIPPTGINSVRLLFFKGNGNKALSLDNVSVQLFEPCTTPVADFAIADTNGLTLEFANQSTGTELTYLWDFGDGDTSIVESPTHTFDTTGTYVVCLTATDTCGTMATVCDTVSVFDCVTPAAAFAIADTNDLELTFSNSSTGTGLSYLWTFGDGDSSMMEAPVHEYDSAGTYTVCLAVTDTCGTTVTVCDTFTLTSTSIGFEFPYELSLYPNPANEFLHLSTTPRIDKVEVFSLLGERVLVQTPNDNQLRMNVSSLANGAYILKVHIKDAVGAYKWIKQ